MSSDECESDCESVDSVVVEEVLEMVFEEDKRLCYRVRTATDEELVMDRSDLMDGAKSQKLTLAFERRCPPPWDVICQHCEGEGCEECICDECDRPCRHIDGVNYGCPYHPVV